MNEEHTHLGPEDHHRAASLVVEVGCHFDVVATQPTPGVMLVEPHVSEQHRVTTESWAGADQDSSVYLDVFGNQCRRIMLPEGRSTISFSAKLTDRRALDDSAIGAVASPIQDLPEDVLQFLLPSRFCESDKIASQALALFGAGSVDGQRINDVINWVHERLRFSYGSSGPTTSAMEALAAGSGVCRDFAHIAIAACRALSVPTRYAFGYLPDIDVAPPPDPQDFCAWMEVFLGGRWWTFDPRNNARRIGRVVVGKGRDAADVAMMTTFGLVELLSMTVIADELPPSTVAAV